MKIKVIYSLKLWILIKKQDRRIQRKSKRKNIFLKTNMYFLRIEKEFLMLLKYFQLKLKL